MLGDIVKDAVASQPDMEIVSSVADGDVSSMARVSGVDVVVVGRDLAERRLEDVDLLRDWWGVRILALTRDGRRLSRCQLRIDRAELANGAAGVSLEQLVSAIRDVGQPGPKEAGDSPS